MIDGPLASGLLSLTSVTLTMFTSISVVIIFAPIFFFPGIAVASLGAILGNIYLKAQLSSKREQRYAPYLSFCEITLILYSSNAKSPVLAHFSAAIAGIGERGFLALYKMLTGHSIHPSIWCSGSL